jgi:O-antigen/teichoic acid export membrane protein
MLYTNLASAVVFLPAMVYAVSRVGAPGAALAWLLANLAYFVPATLVFRRALPLERRRWYARDVGLPLAAAIAVGVTMRLAMPAALDRALTLGYLLLCAACVFAAVLALTPDVRAVVTGRWRAWAAPRPAGRPGAL